MDLLAELENMAFNAFDEPDTNAEPENETIKGGNSFSSTPTQKLPSTSSNTEPTCHVQMYLTSTGK
jgi:hypothetical protein